MYVYQTNKYSNKFTKYPTAHYIKIGSQATMTTTIQTKIDIKKWFMGDLAFKSLYMSCKERPDIQENKITKDSNFRNNNFFRILSKIHGAMESNKEDWFYSLCENQLGIYKHDFSEVLMKSAIVTFLFNTITSKHFIGYTLDMVQIFPKFENTLRKKLVELKEEKIYNLEWMGANYYYKKIFIKPIYFDNMEIPLEVLEFRKYTYFHDMICGHPKASHGWDAESLQELRDLNLVSF